MGIECMKKNCKWNREGWCDKLMGILIDKKGYCVSFAQKQKEAK